MRVSFELNGAERTLECEPRCTLIDALRDELGLTRAKKGCDMGETAAPARSSCDGAAVYAGLMLAVDRAGRRVTTIESFREPSDEDIVRAVCGNLCRCGAYRNILRAAQRVRDASA